jgi:hypothetical protein
MKFQGIVHISLPVFVEFDVPQAQEHFVNNIARHAKEAALKAFEPADLAHKIPTGIKPMQSGRDQFWRSV